MKLKFLFFLISSFFNFILIDNNYSQEYRKTDSIVDNYPKNIIDANVLVGLVKKDFSNQNEKVRAIYRWVTTTIAYDVDLAKELDSKSLNAFSYTTDKEKEKKELLFKLELVTKSLSSKKAVCHGYAALMEILCQKAGVETKTIFGNLKSDPSQIGLLPSEINHAWNVVKIDNNWKFIDATLSAGFISNKTNLFKFYFNDSYFFMNSEDFFMNHFPSEEKWLFISKSKADYAKLPLFFGYYFQLKYHINKQNSGIYSVKNSSKFMFNIEGLNESDYVQYSFNSDNKLHDFEQESTIKNYEVSVADKKNDILAIFVNGKIISMYKIIL